MKKTTRKKIKRKIYQNLNWANIFLAALCIFISFCIVHFSNSIDKHSPNRKDSKNLVDSAIRLADAFDLYNQRRFE